MITSQLLLLVTSCIQGIRVVQLIDKNLVHFIITFRDPLFSTRGAHIVRKNYPHSNKIDNALMWLDALGLRDEKVRNIQDLKYRKDVGWDIKNQSGIFMPDSGNCDHVMQSDKCELPDFSKFYVWRQSKKESRFVIY